MKILAYETEEHQYLSYIKVFLPFLKTREGNKRYKDKMSQETFPLDFQDSSKLTSVKKQPTFTHTEVEGK